MVVGWFAEHMVGIDTKRTSRQMPHARSAVLCSMHDYGYYPAGLCLMFGYFSRLCGRLMRSIILFNAHARSSEISSTQSNTCYVLKE